MSRRLLLILVAVFGVIGVINAGYLSYSALTGIPTLCTITRGCDLVAASVYSKIFGIPLSLFGVFFYSIITGFSLWGLSTRALQVGLFLLPVTTVGFVLSLYFLYLQAFVIEAYCQYCLLSLLDATILFVFTLLLVKRERRVGVVSEHV